MFVWCFVQAKGASRNCCTTFFAEELVRSRLVLSSSSLCCKRWVCFVPVPREALRLDTRIWALSFHRSWFERPRGANDFWRELKYAGDRSDKSRLNQKLANSIEETWSFLRKLRAPPGEKSIATSRSARSVLLNLSSGWALSPPLCLAPTLGDSAELWSLIWRH